MARKWVAVLATVMTLCVSVPALAGQSTYHTRSSERYRRVERHRRGEAGRNQARVRQYRAEVRQDRILIARLDRQVKRDLARHDERRLRRDRARRAAAQAELRRDLALLNRYQREVYADQRNVSNYRRMYRRYR